MSMFWKKPLSELSPEEWEALCDGCAKCCLHRLEDEDTRAIIFTNVHCRLLNTENGRCSDYSHRSQRVPDCIQITLETLQDPYWLPQSCAYRLRAEGKDLPDWHPLISGEPINLFQRDLQGRIICEDEADELHHHLIDWIQ